MAESGFTATELTARACGAVAVVAVEGPGAAGALARLAVSAPAPGRVRLARLSAAPVDGAGASGELLDEALVVGVAPEHFELHLHGSPAVVERILATLGGAPRRPASLEERAAERLAGAPSESGARILLDQSEGALRRALEHLRLAAPADARAGLLALAARGRAAAPHLTAPRVVLAGPSNAGKSTLFNALVGEARVLVDAAPGTTRDAVVERARVGELVVELVDTAGDRRLPEDAAPTLAPEFAVEAAGQALAGRMRAGADLVLWLRPADDPRAAAPTETERLCVLDSRSDQVAAEARAALARPIAPLEDPAAARAVVAAVVAARLGTARWTPGAAVPFEPWQVALVERAAAVAPRDARQRVLAALLGSADAASGRAESVAR